MIDLAPTMFEIVARAFPTYAAPSFSSSNHEMDQSLPLLSYLSWTKSTSGDTDNQRSASHFVSRPLVPPQQGIIRREMR